MRTRDERYRNFITNPRKCGEKFILYYSYYLCARREDALKLCPRTYGLWASRDTVAKQNFRVSKAHGVRRYKVRARTTGA